jgi:ATP-binding cassette subfamily F protein 3
MDRLWLVAGGRVVPYEGDLEDYRRAMLAARPATAERAARPAKPSLSQGARPRNLEALRRAVRQAETAMQAVAAEKQSVEAALTEPELHAAERVRLLRLHADLVARQARAEAAWYEAEESLQAAHAVPAK